MRVSSWLRRLVNPRRTDPRSPEEVRRESVDKEAARQLAIRRGDARRSGALDIPRDRHDSNDWDRYWRKQLEFGLFDQGFSDVMASDETLPALFHRRGARRILCAGNGLSTEPVALALFGFEVTALDLSGVPAQVFVHSFKHPEHPTRKIPGFSMREDGRVSFDAPGAIDVNQCPQMHMGGEASPRGGGSVAFETGSFFDENLCLGPFDVVIERLALQLHSEEERALGLERLTSRLGERGVFVSQQHYGGWRPGEPRQHFAEDWLASHGFQVQSGLHAAPELAPLIARLVFTTG